MALSNVSKTIRDGRLTISDLSDTNEFIIPGLDGVLNYSVPGITRTANLTRGKFADTVGGTPDVMDGDDQAITGSFAGKVRSLSDAAFVTPLEFGLGPSGLVDTGWVSALGASHPSKIWRLKWDFLASNFGEPDEYIRFRWCNFVMSITTGQPTMFTMNFTDFEVAPEIG